MALQSRISTGLGAGQRWMAAKSLPFDCEKPVIQHSSSGNRSFDMPVIDAHPRLQHAEIPTLFAYIGERLSL